MGLIPNLWEELLFFIPEKDLPKGSMDIFGGGELKKLFNKVLVMDTESGPMEHRKERNNKNVLLKGAKLDGNIYELLEKKKGTEPTNFNYVLEKYYEQVECLYFISNWMNINLNQLPQADTNVKGLFHIQFSYYEKHLETFIDHFYPNREAIPKGHFDIAQIIRAHLQNNSKPYIEISGEKGENRPNFIQGKTVIGKASLKKVKKQPLITEKEAEDILLKNIFNLDLKKLK